MLKTDLGGRSDRVVHQNEDPGLLSCLAAGVDARPLYPVVYSMHSCHLLSKITAASYGEFDRKVSSSAYKPPAFQQKMRRPSQLADTGSYRGEGQGQAEFTLGPDGLVQVDAACRHGRAILGTGTWRAASTLPRYRVLPCTRAL